LIKFRTTINQVEISKGDLVMMIFQALRKYAVFNGRAARSEYWLFVLLTIVITNVGHVISPLLGGIIGLGLVIPSIAVAVRRMHDIGKSGWYYLFILIPIVGFIIILVWFCKKGTEGENDYGPDPLSEKSNSIPEVDDSSSN